MQITIDSTDPHAQAQFWADAMGYMVEDNSAFVESLVSSGRLPLEATLEVNGRPQFRDVAAARGTTQEPRLFFQKVPEPKAGKNRVHLDLQVGADAAAAEVERLTELGARLLWTSSDRGPFTYTLADPEGNEFCVS